MGRFETLNEETRDVVTALLPVLAAKFGVAEVVDIIPEDIRMREWDCERRDHIKHRTENDPRHWGVQFLKDLMAIARIKNGDLATFQRDLYDKVRQHEPKHPWCRLADIKEIKAMYQGIVAKEATPPPEDSSTDSYLEELHEVDLPKGSGKRGHHEVYEARIQESTKRRKGKFHICSRCMMLTVLESATRLRRGDDGNFIRIEKNRHSDKHRRSTHRDESEVSNYSHRRPAFTVDESEASDVAAPRPSMHRHRDGGVAPPHRESSQDQSAMRAAVDCSTLPLYVQKMEAELEVAEAELRAARLKHAYIQAKEKAQADMQAPVEVEERETAQEEFQDEVDVGYEEDDYNGEEANDNDAFENYDDNDENGDIDEAFQGYGGSY